MENLLFMFILRCVKNVAPGNNLNDLKNQRENKKQISVSTKKRYEGRFVFKYQHLALGILIFNPFFKRLNLVNQVLKTLYLKAKK